jgi:hypothetical protein
MQLHPYTENDDITKSVVLVENITLDTVTILIFFENCNFMNVLTKVFDDLEYEYKFSYSTVDFDEFLPADPNKINNIKNMFPESLLLSKIESTEVFFVEIMDTLTTYCQYIKNQEKMQKYIGKPDYEKKQDFFKKSDPIENFKPWEIEQTLGLPLSGDIRGNPLTKQIRPQNDDFNPIAFNDDNLFATINNNNIICSKQVELFNISVLFSKCNKVTLILQGDDCQHIDFLCDKFPDFVLIKSYEQLNRKQVKDLNNFFDGRDFETIELVQTKLESFEQLFDLNEKDESDDEQTIIVSYFRSKFIVSDDSKKIMKATIIQEHITKDLKIGSHDPIQFKKRLSGYLLEIGLKKKRLSDGIYYYGLELNVTNKPSSDQRMSFIEMMNERCYDKDIKKFSDAFSDIANERDELDNEIKNISRKSIIDAMKVERDINPTFKILTLKRAARIGDTLAIEELEQEKKEQQAILDKKEKEMEQLSK